MKNSGDNFPVVIKKKTEISLKHHIFCFVAIAVIVAIWFYALRIFSDVPVEKQVNIEEQVNNENVLMREVVINGKVFEIIERF
jgi:hypothetical protein